MEEEEAPQPISDETNNNTTADDVFITSSSSVDTSRPFTSVKEAVAIFGDRLLSASGSPKPSSSSLVSSSPNAYSIPIQRDPSRRLSSSPIMKPINRSEDEETKEEEGGSAVVVLDTLRKLEAELEKTKAELKLLKERGTETEVALATLNAQLHKNMSKLAHAEALAAGKAAAASKTVRFEINQEGGVDDDDGINNKKEKKMKEYIARRMDESKTLAHILSLGENDHLLNYNNKKLHHHHHHNISLRKKHKPIIPLVGDYFLFFKRKPPSPTNHHI